MQQFGGKDSKRHFTVVMGGKEHGLYISSTPSSAAKKAVTKLCTANKSKKVEFSIREITQGSKKKTYGPYEGHIEKLKEPIELKGRVIKYKPVAKLSGKTSSKKGGQRGGAVYFMVKFNKLISKNNSITAETICKNFKEYLKKDDLAMNDIETIEDIDENTLKILMKPDEQKLKFRSIKVFFNEFIERTYKRNMTINDKREMIKIYNTENPSKIWNGTTYEWKNI